MLSKEAIEQNGHVIVDLLFFLITDLFKRSDWDKSGHDARYYYEIFRGLCTGLFIMLNALGVRPEKITEDVMSHHPELDEGGRRFFENLKEFGAVIKGDDEGEAKEAMPAYCAIMFAFFPYVLKGLEGEWLERREGELRLLAAMSAPLMAELTSIPEMCAIANQSLEEFMEVSRAEGIVDNPEYRVLRLGLKNILDPAHLPDRFRQQAQYYERQYYQKWSMN
jgi:hypothetical protein